jgi:hypothetical protein
MLFREKINKNRVDGGKERKRVRERMIELR